MGIVNGPEPDDTVPSVAEGRLIATRTGFCGAPGAVPGDADVEGTASIGTIPGARPPAGAAVPLGEGAGDVGAGVVGVVVGDVC